MQSANRSAVNGCGPTVGLDLIILVILVILVLILYIIIFLVVIGIHATLYFLLVASSIVEVLMSIDLAVSSPLSKKKHTSSSTFDKRKNSTSVSYVLRRCSSTADHRDPELLAIWHLVSTYAASDGSAPHPLSSGNRLVHLFWTLIPIAFIVYRRRRPLFVRHPIYLWFKRVRQM